MIVYISEKVCPHCGFTKWLKRNMVSKGYTTLRYDCSYCQNQRTIKWRKKNPNVKYYDTEQTKEKRRLYRQQPEVKNKLNLLRRTKYRFQLSEHQRKRRAELTDGVLISYLHRLNIYTISPQDISKYREHLKTLRLYNESIKNK